MHAHLVFEKRKSVYVVQTKIVRHEQQCAQSVQDTMVLNIHQQQYYVIMLLFFLIQRERKAELEKQDEWKGKKQNKRYA